jgi:hypothetical protein
VNERGVVKSCATSVVVRGLGGSAIMARAMRSRRYLRAWSPMMLLVGGWLGTVAVPAHAAPDHASVLILLPGQPGLPASTAIASGIRAALLTEWSFRVTSKWSMSTSLASRRRRQKSVGSERSTARSTEISAST